MSLQYRTPVEAAQNTEAPCDTPSSPRALQAPDPQTGRWLLKAGNSAGGWGADSLPLECSFYLYIYILKNGCDWSSKNLLQRQ